MQSEERQISVWVCQEEKLVLGLSKRTTCADVLRVLLLDDHHNARVKVSKQVTLRRRPQSYCVVEIWKELERVLPDNTRILRLWDAWGAEEQGNVKFVLFQQEPSAVFAAHDARLCVPAGAAVGPCRSAEARVVRSKDSPPAAAGATNSNAAMCFSPGKQRRIVRKAFRKLEKINKKKTRATSVDATSIRMETIIHRVASQDHAIRQQVHRIHELDKEIDCFEAQVHADRMKSHGVNYVQDTYSVDGPVERPFTREGDALSSVDRIANMEEYLRQCQEMVKLQERLEDHEALVDSMTRDIQEELNRRWMERRRREEKPMACTTSPPHLMKTPGMHTVGLVAGNDCLLDHVERIRTELDASLYIGLRLDTDLVAIDHDLQLTQVTLRAREREIHALLKQLDTLDADEEPLTFEKCSDNVPKEGEMVWSLETKRGWVEQTRCCNISQDEDSDTGISSLHSQDSDTYPVISLT
ncbi:ras association domain-containing protein 10 [Gadus chalcogrammus]|uniref:ras association domain-containing protein 10 n=1 Tax=Gadus chalcogrammus TaxID=1042646 RepID=UPI0024C47D91|nr:ras association domain-containing protein 10 [Gadus chalcogrammus]